MSDSGTKEAVITAASHLCCLLDDPQHGLASWHEACETWYRRLLEAAATEQTRALSETVTRAELPSYSVELLAANYPTRTDASILSGPYTPTYIAAKRIEAAVAERDQLASMDDAAMDKMQAMIQEQSERIVAVASYAELLAEALTKVTERGPYSVNGGMACATCTTFWHADPVVTKWQTEHHYNGCAYVIARDALAKNPNPAGVGSSVVSAAEGHEPGSGDSTPHTARNCGTGLACTMDRESGASHPVGEGYEGRNVHELDLLAAVSAVLRQDDSTAEGSLQKALGHLQAVLFDYETVDARSRHQSCTKLEWALRQGDVLADWCNVSGAALAALMDAFERRARSHCTAAEIEREPWRCSEFIEAERALTSKPVPVVSIDASGVPACAECGALPDEKCVHQVNQEPSAAELRHRLSDMCHEYELVAGKLIAAAATLNLIAKWGNPDAETELPAMAARLVLTKIGEASDSQSVAGKKCGMCGDTGVVEGGNDDREVHPCPKCHAIGTKP